MARRPNITSKRGRASQKSRQKILRTPKTTFTKNGVVRRDGSDRSRKRRK